MCCILLCCIGGGGDENRDELKVKTRRVSKHEGELDVEEMRGWEGALAKTIWKTTIL